MTWSRAQYEDRIRDRLGDLGIRQHIDETRIPLALERALATFTKDRPPELTATGSGNGTQQAFDLAALAGWEAGWSRLVSVEYPTGNIPRTYLDAGYDFAVTDDTIEFDDAPEAGTDNIRFRFTGRWAFPDDDPSDDTTPIPEVYAQAVADLAAAGITRGKANEYARQQSTSVAGDLFQRDATALYDGARDLEAAYKDTVLGRPSSDDGRKGKPAMATSDVDVFPASLFHRRADYDAEEDYA
jgi:hypothetical protein